MVSIWSSPPMKSSITFYQHSCSNYLVRSSISLRLLFDQLQANFWRLGIKMSSTESGISDNRRREQGSTGTMGFRCSDSASFRKESFRVSSISNFSWLAHHPWHRCLRSSQQSSQRKVKARKAIVSEIQAVIRQITASVSFLPLLHEPSTFDLLVYTNKDSNVPALWEESDPRYVKNSAQVRLRSFDTNVSCDETFLLYEL